MAEVSLKNLKDNPERLATLIDKVKKGSPFTKVGGKIENDRDNVYLEFLYPEIENALLEKKGLTHQDISGRGKNKIFRNTKKKSELLGLSDLEKTAELGSSKGSGGGAEATAITESMQCFFTAYLFNGSNADFNFSKDYEKELKTFYKSVANNDYVHAYNKASRYEFNALWDKSPKDEEWLQTYMATANMIKLKSTKFNGNVYFHRGSPFMDSIYARKRKCEKHNRDLIKSGTSIGEINEAVASFSDDKWNPGDIWMSTINPNAKYPDLEFLNLKSGNNIIIPQHPLGDFFF